MTEFAVAYKRHALVGISVRSGGGMVCQQRELRDAVQLMRSLLSETGGIGAAPDGMRERLVALLNAGKPAGAGFERTDAGKAGCGPAAARSENRAETAAAPQVPLGPAEAEGPGQTAAVETGEPGAKLSRQGDLL